MHSIPEFSFMVMGTACALLLLISPLLSKHTRCTTLSHHTDDEVLIVTSQSSYPLVRHKFDSRRNSRSHSLLCRHRLP